MIQQRKLKAAKPQQKYLILLSDQTVIVDEEFEAMKKAIKTQKPIIDMLPCSNKMGAQKTNLTLLLEKLESNKQVYKTNS